MRPGPQQKFAEPVSFSLILERRERDLLRRLAQRRRKNMSDLIRERLEASVAEAETIFGDAVPGRKEN